MTDRTKLLVHLRRLSDLLSKVFREGPDGSLEGKFAVEHPDFVHYTCGIYLAGCLAFLEGEDGSYSWRGASAHNRNFDTFVSAYPEPPKTSYKSRGVTTAALDALACIRNAIIHNDGDLSKNRNSSCFLMVAQAGLPGVALKGTVVRLKPDFLEFVRIATLAVRNYHGEF